MASHEDLTKAKLKLELKLLSLEIKATKKRLNQKPNGLKSFLSEWGPALLTPITIISVVVGIYMQGHNYMAERQKANQLQITNSFLNLTKMLSDDKRQVQEMGYISFTHFGKDALPYLLSHIESTERLARVAWAIKQIKADNEVNAQTDIFEPLKMAAEEIVAKPKIDDADIKAYLNILNALDLLSAEIEIEVAGFLQEQKQILVEQRDIGHYEPLVVNRLVKQIGSILTRLNQG